MERVVASVSLAAAVAGAAYAEPTQVASGSFWGSGYWVVRATGVSAPALSAKIDQVPFGEPLITQVFRPSTVVETEQRLDLIPARRSKRQAEPEIFSLRSGEILYEFVIFAGKRSNYTGEVKAYCTRDRAVVGGLAAYTPHLCLYDADFDGAFDHFVGTSGRTLGAMFSGFVVSQATALRTPVRYRVKDFDQDLVKVGIVAKARADGVRLFWSVLFEKKWRLERFGPRRSLQVGEEVGREPIDAEIAGWIKQSALPATITYSGLRVTIVGVPDAGVAYQLKAPLSPDKPYLLGYIGEFPVE